MHNEAAKSEAEAPLQFLFDLAWFLVRNIKNPLVYTPLLITVLLSVLLVVTGQTAIIWPIVGFAVSAVVIDILSWSGGLRWGPRAKKYRRVTMYIPWTHQAQFAGLYCAVGEGYYEARDIKVTIRPVGFETTLDPITLVLARENAFGISGSLDLLLARTKGKAIKAIAAIYQRSPVCLISKEDSPILKPDDLVGKTVGISKREDNVELEYRLWLRGVDLQYKRIIRRFDQLADIEPLDDWITEVQFEGTTLVEMYPFIGGYVNCWTGYSINEPLRLRRMGIPVHVTHTETNDIPIYGECLFTTDKVIQEERELVQGFTAATVQGWEFAARNQSEALKHVMAHMASESDASHQRVMLQETIKLVCSDCDCDIGTMRQTTWEGIQQLLYNVHMIDSPLNDIHDVFMDSFVHTYHKQQSQRTDTPP